MKRIPFVLAGIVAVACVCALAAPQEIAVEATGPDGQPVFEAVCDLTNRNGSWRVVTPGTATIDSSGDWLAVKCIKGFELAGSVTTFEAGRAPARRPSISGAPPEFPVRPPAARLRVAMQDPARVPGSRTDTQVVQGTRPTAVAQLFVPPKEAVPVETPAAPTAVPAPEMPIPLPTPQAEVVPPTTVVANLSTPAATPPSPPAPPAPDATPVAIADIPIPLPRPQAAFTVVAEPVEVPATVAVAAAPVPLAQAPAMPVPDRVAGAQPIPLPQAQAAFTVPAVPVEPERPIVVVAAQTASVAPPRPAPDFYDVKAVPYLRPEGRSVYAEFRNYPLPRAFAIAKNGQWGWAVRGLDARKMALETCERRAGAPCELYAVDQQVVWAGVQ